MIPNQLIIQVVCYAVVIALVIFILSVVMRGYFWKFLKVKASMGRLILIKSRGINIDTFIVGKIEDDFLVYKQNKEDKRVAINDRSVFYRSIGITWVDIDESKNCLVKPDFTTIEGYDPVKYNNLYLRALYKPAITNNLEKVMLILCIVSALGIVVCIFLIMKQSSMLANLQSQLIGLTTSVQGIITPAPI